MGRPSEALKKLKEKGIVAKSDAISPILKESSFDKVESIEHIPLNQIYAKKEQVRFKLNEDVIQGILDSWPVTNMVVVRTRNPELDHDVPESYKYVLLSGHHRFEAMTRYGLTDSKFKLIPRHEVDTIQKIIAHQLNENLVKHDMHIIEQAFSFMAYLGYERGTKKREIYPDGVKPPSQREILKILKIRESKGPVYRKIFMNLTEKDIALINEKDIKIEAAIQHIAGLIEIGVKNWFEILEPHARDADGSFNPKKLSGDLVKGVLDSIEAGIKAEAEQKAQLEEQSKTPISQPTVPKTEVLPTNDVDDEPPTPPKTEALPTNDVDDELPTPLQQVEPEKPQNTSQTENKSVNDVDTVSEVGQVNIESTPKEHVNEIPKKARNKDLRKSVLFTTSKNKSSAVDIRSLIVAFQEILSGQSVEDLIEKLGPTFTSQVTQADGDEIYDLVQKIKEL